MIQPDLLIAQLVLDYLRTPESIAVGVPDDATLPKDIMDSGKKEVFPSLIIAAKEEGSRGAKRRVIMAPMMLTWLKSSDPVAANVNEQTTRQQASEWMRKIDERLRDLVALGAFLKDLPLDRREGWVMLAYPRTGGDFPPLYSKETAKIVYGLTQTWHICIGP